jgi:hypothetical protein
MKPTSITKTTLVITIAAATLSCGENKKERAQRESDAADRQMLLEYQRQENIQRQRDRDQRTLETGVQVLEVLTR